MFRLLNPLLSCVATPTNWRRRIDLRDLTTTSSEHCPQTKINIYFHFSYFDIPRFNFPRFKQSTVKSLSINLHIHYSQCRISLILCNFVSIHRAFFVTSDYHKAIVNTTMPREKSLAKLPSSSRLRF